MTVRNMAEEVDDRRLKYKRFEVIRHNKKARDKRDFDVPCL